MISSHDTDRVLKLHTVTGLPTLSRVRPTSAFCEDMGGLGRGSQTLFDKMFLSGEYQFRWSGIALVNTGGCLQGLKILGSISTGVGRTMEHKSLLLVQALGFISTAGPV